MDILTKSEFGILYVAVGSGYLKETSDSFRSLRLVHPDIPVVIFTDRPKEFTERDANTQVIFLEDTNGTSHDKIRGISRSPFNKTIFLDTDTIILRSLDDISIILDKYDLAMAFDPIRDDYPQPEIPDGFATLNSGVMAYRRCEILQKLFSEWLAAFHSQEILPGQTARDQPPLRKLLYKSNVRLLTLPDEYNLRVIFPYLVGGNAYPRILHGRGSQLDEARSSGGTMHFFPRVFGRTYSVGELFSMLIHRVFERFWTRMKFIK